MNRLPLYLIAASAVLAVVIWLVGAPGCNPDDPSARLAREHAARADSAEAVADREHDARLVIERERDLARDSLLIFSERTKQATASADAANAEADRLLALYRGAAANPAGEGGAAVSCAAALDACTVARRESAALVSAQRVEIRALSDQVSRLTRIDSLRAGETLALRSALGEMRSAYEGMEAAYESERAARLSAKRRLWIERGVWIGVVTFAVTR